MWKKSWRDGDVINGPFVKDPTQKFPRFELPRAMLNGHLGRLGTNFVVYIYFKVSGFV